MTIFPELQRELTRLGRPARTAASARDARTPGSPGRRRRRRIAAAVPGVASGLIVVAVTVAALALLGHGRARGPAGRAATAGRTRAVQMRLIASADRRAFATPACRQRTRPLPKLSDQAPSASLLSVLGVLRRPAAARDQLPLLLHLGPGVRGIQTRYIRLAQTRNGVGYYLVPVLSQSPGRPLPARCSAAQVAALRAELSGIPPRARAATIALQAEQIAGERRILQRLNTPGVCLMLESVQALSGQCGATGSEIRRQGLLTDLGPLSGVVPDGVASVTVGYPATAHRRALTVTAGVVGNVFATGIRPPTRGNVQPTLIWRSALGRVLRVAPGAGRTMGYSFCGGRPAPGPRRTQC